MKKFSFILYLAIIATGIFFFVNPKNIIENNKINENEVATGIVKFLHDGGGKLPKLIKIDYAVEQVCRLHEENNGATFSLRWESLATLELYSVSLFPDLGLVLPGKDIPKEMLQKFIEQHQQLLSDPRCCIGTWFNEEDQNTYLDISVVLENKDNAIALARKYNQIAIWDLKNSQEINTGGNGKTLQNLPEPQQRLPKVSWKRE